MRTATWLDTAGSRRRSARAKAAASTQARRGIAFVDLAAGAVRFRALGRGEPALVFTPDGPNVIEHYDGLFARLAPSLRVICFEPPGFGFSFPANGYGFTVEEQSRVTEEFLRAIEVDRAVLAFSCGNAYAALDLAARSPDLISRLVLIQAASWNEQRKWARRIDTGGIGRTPIVGQLAFRLARRRFARGWYRAAIPMDHRPDRFARPAVAALDQGACFCLPSFLQSNMYRDLGFSAPPQPTLVVTGGRDRTHAKSDLQSLSEHVPDAQWLKFRDAGHFPELESPDRFCDAVLRFVGPDHSRQKRPSGDSARQPRGAPGR